MRFSEMTAPAISELPRDKSLIIAPIAACEQHSRHLPVFTDSILVGAVADGVERNLPDSVLLLPVFWLGASEHHLPFGGTLTATLPTYEQLLMELLTPLLRSGFRRTLLLNGHGGNIDPMRVALRRLENQFTRAILTGAAYWEIAEAELAGLGEGPRKTMGHACEFETSMILHLRPDLVRKELIQDDPETTPASLSGVYWARDFGRRTQHGAVGHPEAANADRGRRMLEAVIRRVTTAVQGLLELPLED
jgi:creatinine amidohydrolase